jgi:hypothetical protein
MTKITNSSTKSPKKPQYAGIAERRLFVAKVAAY